MDQKNHHSYTTRTRNSDRRIAKFAAVEAVKKHALATYSTLTFAISWGGILGVPAPNFSQTREEFERLLPSVVLMMLAGPSFVGILLTALSRRDGLLSDTRIDGRSAPFHRVHASYASIGLIAHVSKTPHLGDRLHRCRRFPYDVDGNKSKETATWALEPGWAHDA
jgi:hypothetical protein